MYYEEKVINGILYCRYTPYGEWEEVRKRQSQNKDMTPKEKAKELFEKYYIISLNNFQNVLNSIKLAKMLATITVDEMLSIERKYSNFGGVVYLQEVKEEIEKL